MSDMKIFRYPFFLVLLLPFALGAQITGKTRTASPPTDLFTVASDRSSAGAQVGAELEAFALLDVSADAYAGLRSSSPGNWSLRLPKTSLAPQLTLHLRPRPLLSPDFRLRLGSNDAVVAADLGDHYVGTVAGQPGSRVALSLLDEELTATITYTDGRRLALGKLRGTPKGADREAYVLFPDRQLLNRQELDCATADSGIPYSPKELTLPQKKSTGGCVDVYFEIDHDIVLEKGSVNAAAQHLAANFNESAILYETIGVNLSISEIRAWDGPSPYSGNSSTTLLTQFQSLRTQFNGDVAQLVSYQASGGVAVLDGLCHPFVAARMSFSSIRSNFQAVPIYSWSTMVISHELGHLMGSQHTHACVWNGNDTAIDGCPGWTEGFCGTPGIPAAGGTIMSYCHLTTSGINFNLGFGPQPAAVIAGRVAAAQNCVQSVCAGGDGTGGGSDGENDDDGPDDVVSEPCEEQTVFLRLTLDDFGMETTWELRTETGGVLAGGGPYPKKQKGRVIRDTICVPDGCYNFVIADDDKDGICCTYGAGSFELRDTLDNLLGIGGQFDSIQVIDFCLPNLPDDDDADCATLNFNTTPPRTFGTNQDVGQLAVLDNGATIRLQNNAWKAVAMDYTVTEDTWVSFWFRSTRRGEVHGIGFDNNEVISPNLTFQVHGTQNWGIQEFNNYPNNGSWVYYQIPVGEFYTGNAAYLFFVADHDVGTRDGNSFFRGVKLSEGGPCGSADLPETTAPAPTEEALRVAPNPAGDVLNVLLPAGTPTADYRVIDLAGRTLIGGRLTGERTAVSVADLPAGTYVLRCDGKNGMQATRFTVVR